MADLPPPYFDPSQYPAYLDMQRKQQMAQMLMGSLQQANQTPSDWNSMKVVPKRGMLQNVAVLADALMAKKGLDASNAASTQYMQGLYGGGTQSPDAAAVSAASEGPPSPGAAPGAPVQAVSGNVQPQNPLIPPGMDRRQAAMISGAPGGMEALTKAAVERSAPLEFQRQLHAAGIDPDSPLGQKLQQDVIAKSTNIAPIDVRPGGTLYDPITHQPIASAPNGAIQTKWGPNGPTQAVVPGGDQALAQVQGAETGARTANTPTVIPTKGGGSTFGYPGDVLHTAPPALRAAGAPPPAAAPPSNGQAAPAGGQAAPSPKDPWQAIPKLAVSNSVGAPDEFTKGVLQAAGTKHAELSTRYGQDADLADQKLTYNAEARKALPNAEVGPLSEWLTHSRASLVEMGVPKALIPESGAVTPTLELNKNLKNAALQGAKATFGSRMTQNEVMLQHEELSPSTSMTRDAIASLMNQDDIKQQYAKQRSEDYGQYVQKGGDPLRFESWYSKNFPLTKYAQAASATVAPVAPTVTHAPADLEAEMRRRGLMK